MLSHRLFPLLLTASQKRVLGRKTSSAVRLRLGSRQCVPELDVSAKEYTSRGKNILGKCTRKCLLAADLLAADERVNRHRNGTVNILRRAEVGQTHPAERLRNTHNGFKMTDL